MIAAMLSTRPTPLWLIMLVALPGCASTDRGEFVSRHPIDMTARSEEADRLWGSVCDTLRAHHYDLDRVDRNAGVVTSLPAASQHFFEIWRKDVATRRDFWEATLNPLRRRVEVSLGGEDGWSTISVAVHKERFSGPDRQFNSTGSAYQFFGNRLPSTMGHTEITSAQERWVSVGRDPAMEDYVLRAILERASLE